ncbi:MAG: CZB domain-containing protein [Methylovulum miyakonense]|uniref:CZB domain-containing protein n=1 Tax=Methylovulum miyakonense TaxID=645578 RepID=UPI003BB64D28
MWKSRIRDFLNGKGSMNLGQAVSHHDCDLGKWLYAKGLEQYGHLATMREMEKAHVKLHATVKDILDFKNGGKAKQAEKEFQKIDHYSQRIVALLNDIERESAVAVA